MLISKTTYLIAVYSQSFFSQVCICSKSYRRVTTFPEITIFLKILVLKENLHIHNFPCSNTNWCESKLNLAPQFSVKFYFIILNTKFYHKSDFFLAHYTVRRHIGFRRVKVVIFTTFGMKNTNPVSVLL